VARRLGFTGFTAVTTALLFVASLLAWGSQAWLPALVAEELKALARALFLIALASAGLLTLSLLRAALAWLLSRLARSIGKPASEET
jgi:hypothetical protein